MLQVTRIHKLKLQVSLDSAQYWSNFADASDKCDYVGTNTRASPAVPEGPKLSDEPTAAGTNGDHDGTAGDISWLDATGFHAQFSAGDEGPDSMAESLARALRDAGIGGTDGQPGGDECPLHEEDEVYGADEDPFYCEGTDGSILLRLYLLNQYGQGQNSTQSHARI